MRIRTSRRLGVVYALVALLPLAACGGGSGAGGERNAPSSITVLAASSLTGAFTELGKRFESENPGVTVKFAFDSSATLAQQAVGGAPADVLATADEKTMNSAQQVQLDEPKVFATNVMVLVTPADNPAGITSFSDLNKSSVKYVVCVPTAPCGSVGAALLAAEPHHQRPGEHRGRREVRAGEGHLGRGRRRGGLQDRCDRRGRPGEDPARSRARRARSRRTRS